MAGRTSRQPVLPAIWRESELDGLVYVAADGAWTPLDFVPAYSMAEFPSKFLAGDIGKRSRGFRALEHLGFSAKVASGKEKL
jgi:hypothetical protein